MWVVFSWMTDIFPGDQTWLSAGFAGALVAILATLRRLPPVSIASWEEGAFGEVETEKQLRALEDDGWVVLHDLANGSASFDHVVLGPSGVYCLNSKWSGYRLERAADGRLVGRHQYDDDLYRDVEPILRGARREAAALSEQITQRCGQRLWVKPVVVWWGAVANSSMLLDGVGIVEGKNLTERLRTQQGRPVPQFDEVLAALQPGRHARRRVLI